MRSHYLLLMVIMAVVSHLDSPDHMGLFPGCRVYILD